MLIETLVATRDVGRLNTIAGVLIRHGLGDVVHRLGLADKLERAGQAVMWRHTAYLGRLEPPVQVRPAVRFLVLIFPRDFDPCLV